MAVVDMMVDFLAAVVGGKMADFALAVGNSELGMVESDRNLMIFEGLDKKE